MIESSSAGGTKGGAIISEPPLALDATDSAEAALALAGGGAPDVELDSCSCFFGGGISAAGAGAAALLLVRVVAAATPAATAAACLTFADAAEDSCDNAAVAADDDDAAVALLPFVTKVRLWCLGSGAST